MPKLDTMVSWWPTVMEIRQSGTPCRYAEGVEGIAIFTDLELDPDTLVADHCGSCTAGLDACPTQALDGPYNMVIERCLIGSEHQHRRPVPEVYVDTQAGHLSGCDICQDVCPFNRKSGGSPDVIPPAPERWSEATILDLLACDERERQLLFAGSLLDAPTPVVREAAAWALAH